MCFLSRFIEQASCNVHTTASSNPELHGCMFIDNEGNVAVAAAHNWRLDDTAGYQTCLIKASIDNRVFKYPEHIDNLPHINQIEHNRPSIWQGHHRRWQYVLDLPSQQYEQNEQRLAHDVIGNTTKAKAVPWWRCTVQRI